MPITPSGYQGMFDTPQAQQQYPTPALSTSFMTGGQMGYMPQAQFLTDASYGAFRTIAPSRDITPTYAQPGFFKSAAIAAGNHLPTPFHTYNPAADPLRYRAEAAQYVGDSLVGFGAGSLGAAIELGTQMGSYKYMMHRYAAKHGAEAASKLGIFSKAIRFGGSMIPGFIAGAAYDVLKDNLVNRIAGVRDIQRLTAAKIHGGEYSNSAHGLGFNSEAANDIEQYMYRSAIGDAHFKYGDYRNMLAMGIKNGMFDYSKTPEQYKRVMKQIKDSMFTVMEVVGSQDFKDVMKQMKRLHDMGATANEYSRISRMENLASRITGLSHNDLVNNYGQQGAMLFNNYGYTPIVGSQVAIQNTAMVHMAMREGLLSPSAVAAAGGISGVSQRMTQADVGVLNKYKKMLVYAMINPETGKLDKSVDFFDFVRDKNNGLQRLEQRAANNFATIDPNKRNLVDAKLNTYFDAITKNIDPTMGVKLSEAGMAKMVGERIHRGDKDVDPHTILMSGMRAMGKDALTSFVEISSLGKLIDSQDSEYRRKLEAQYQQRIDENKLFSSLGRTLREGFLGSLDKMFRGVIRSITSNTEVLERATLAYKTNIEKITAAFSTGIDGLVQDKDGNKIPTNPGGTPMPGLRSEFMPAGGIQELIKTGQIGDWTQYFETGVKDLKAAVGVVDAAKDGVTDFGKEQISLAKNNANVSDFSEWMKQLKAMNPDAFYQLAKAAAEDKFIRDPSGDDLLEIGYMITTPLAEGAQNRKNIENSNFVKTYKALAATDEGRVALDASQKAVNLKRFNLQLQEALKGMRANGVSEADISNLTNTRAFIELIYESSRFGEGGDFMIKAVSKAAQDRRPDGGIRLQTIAREYYNEINEYMKSGKGKPSWKTRFDMSNPNSEPATVIRLATAEDNGFSSNPFNPQLNPVEAGYEEKNDRLQPEEHDKEQLEKFKKLSQKEAIAEIKKYSGPLSNNDKNWDILKLEEFNPEFLKKLAYWSYLFNKKMGSKGYKLEMAYGKNGKHSLIGKHPIGQAIDVHVLHNGQHENIETKHNAGTPAKRTEVAKTFLMTSLTAGIGFPHLYGTGTAGKKEGWHAENNFVNLGESFGYLGKPKEAKGQQALGALSPTEQEAASRNPLIFADEKARERFKNDFMRISKEMYESAILPPPKSGKGDDIIVMQSTYSDEQLTNKGEGFNKDVLEQGIEFLKPLTTAYTFKGIYTKNQGDPTATSVKGVDLLIKGNKYLQSALEKHKIKIEGNPGFLQSLKQLYDSAKRLNGDKNYTFDVINDENKFKQYKKNVLAEVLQTYVNNNRRNLPRNIREALKGIIKNDEALYKISIGLNPFSNALYGSLFANDPALTQPYIKERDNYYAGKLKTHVAQMNKFREAFEKKIDESYLNREKVTVPTNFGFNRGYYLQNGEFTESIPELDKESKDAISQDGQNLWKYALTSSITKRDKSGKKVDLSDGINIIKALYSPLTGDDKEEKIKESIKLLEDASDYLNNTPEGIGLASSTLSNLFFKITRDLHIDAGQTEESKKAYEKFSSHILNLKELPRISPSLAKDIEEASTKYNTRGLTRQQVFYDTVRSNATVRTLYSALGINEGDKSSIFDAVPKKSHEEFLKILKHIKKENKPLGGLTPEKANEILESYKQFTKLNSKYKVDYSMWLAPHIAQLMGDTNNWRGMSEAISPKAPGDAKQKADALGANNFPGMQKDGGIVITPSSSIEEAVDKNSRVLTELSKVIGELNVTLNKMNGKVETKGLGGD